MIINEGRINKILEEVNNLKSENLKREQLEIIEKASNLEGLSLEETGKLLCPVDDEVRVKLYERAKYIKEKIYGKRVVLFAPLYTSNECSNNCEYCAFKITNTALHRKTLNMDEIISECNFLVNEGHKRILLVCGEDSRYTSASQIAGWVEGIYKNCDIRRININCAPLSVEDFKVLKASNIGTYQLFQETYCKDAYKKYHLKGNKANYEYRLSGMDRAMEAGIDDVGIGTLLGLYDYKFEVLAMLMHSEYLMDKFGAGPHTISVPRLRPALGAEEFRTGYEINDENLKDIVAILRVAVPYTGIILSTRESQNMRDELLNLGVSQMSAGSHTDVGGYEDAKEKKNSQFSISDERDVHEITKSICESGYVPSYCTACYRRGRTGEKFMEYARHGEISKYCQPNAILTFKENILDYGEKDNEKLYNNTIEKALNDIIDEDIKLKTLEKLKELENGKRDLYF